MIKWAEVDELDQIDFELEFGVGFADKIKRCTDMGSLMILIELAKSRLAALNPR